MRWSDDNKTRKREEMPRPRTERNKIGNTFFPSFLLVFFIPGFGVFFLLLGEGRSGGIRWDGGGGGLRKGGGEGGRNGRRNGVKETKADER